MRSLFLIILCMALVPRFAAKEETIYADKAETYEAVYVEGEAEENKEVEVEVEVYVEGEVEENKEVEGEVEENKEVEVEVEADVYTMYYTPDEFCELVNGVWMVSNDTNSAISFIVFTLDGHMHSGVYPGEFGRSCQVSNIVHLADGSLQLELFYPEEPETEMYEAMPEMIAFVTVSSQDNFEQSFTLTNYNGTKFEYTYVAESFDEAVTLFDAIWMESFNY